MRFRRVCPSPAIRYRKRCRREHSGYNTAQCTQLDPFDRPADELIGPSSHNALYAKGSIFQCSTSSFPLPLVHPRVLSQLPTSRFRLPVRPPAATCHSPTSLSDVTRMRTGSLQLKKSSPLPQPPFSLRHGLTSPLPVALRPRIARYNIEQVGKVTGHCQVVLDGAESQRSLSDERELRATSPPCPSFRFV